MEESTMKKTALVLLMCMSVAAFAQDADTQSDVKTKKAQAKEMSADNVKAEKGKTLHGYVVDQMCAKGMAKKGDPMARAAKHTKECALEEACAASGYGLFYENGKWIKFDDNGDRLAREMFESSQKSSDFQADVTGEIKGEKFIVASLVESKKPDADKPMKDDAHHGHDHK